MDLRSITNFGQAGFSRAEESLSSTRTQQAAALADQARRSSGFDNIDPQKLDELEKVAGKFESLFVEQMLSSMRDTLNKENRLFHGGQAESYFEDMLYQEYAAKIAEQGDLGIADMIVDQYRSVL